MESKNLKDNFLLQQMLYMLAESFYFPFFLKYYKDQNKFFQVNGHGYVDEITKRLFDLIDSFNLL